MDIAKRAIDAGAESAFVVLGKAKELEAQGKKIIHLEIGEPDFVTPLHIREAAIEALRKGETHYTPTPGLPELRESIAKKTKQDLGIDLNWRENVLVTVGAKEGVFAALASVLEQGDEVILPNPGYPAYQGATKFFHGRPVSVKLREGNEFRMTAQEVSKLITGKTKAIVLNSPENPTGSVLTKEDVKGITELAREKGIYVISDEIYKYLIYDGTRNCSPAEFDPNLERTIILDGFSKGYAMTGWRLGYMIVPKYLLPFTTKILNLMTSCVSMFVQRGGIAALEGPMEPVYEMVRTYQQRRNVLMEEIERTKQLSMVKPRGAFYGFVNVKQVLKNGIMNSEGLMRFILEKYGVAVLHGTAMGSNGEGYIRISYANSVENIREGVRIINKAVHDIREGSAL